jgi:uncharacterized membrane protein YjjP (DUF1212 family)
MQQNARLTEEMADELLKISAMLMTSGANTNRVLLILNKFAFLMNVDAQVFINHKAFIISLTHKISGERTTQVRRLPHHGVNFDIISALSRAGFKAEKENWDFDTIKQEIVRIQKMKRFPRILTLIATGLAGAGFCNLFNGDYISMAVVFAATFIGLFVKQTFDRLKFNPLICAFTGTLISGLLAGLVMSFIPDIDPNIAIATSVLFIIPGVALINAFTDMIDGYIITGFVRFMSAFLYITAIALALFIVMYIFGIQYL